MEKDAESPVEQKEKTASQGNRIWFPLETVLRTHGPVVVSKPLPAGRGSDDC